LAGEPKKVFVREATGLVRSISASDAFLGNILAMGIAYFFVFEFFATLLFPGVNLPVTIIVTLIPGIVVALLYYLFTVAMPRTGGDYVWTSRILGAPLGFMTNFVLTFTWMASMATAVAWGISYGVVPSIAAIGMVQSNSGLLSLASTLSVPNNAFVITALLIVVSIVPVLLGTRAAFRFMWAMFAISLIGALVTVVAFYSASNATFVANFNHFSGMDYQKTITNSALPLGFALGATITGSIFTMTNFLGFFSSAYFSGEVKRVARSQIIGMFGSLFFLMIIAFLIYGSAYYSAGSDFLNAVSLNFVTGTNYTLPAVPTLNFLVAFASPNPAVIAISGIALLATGIGGATLFAFVCVRNLFAWSFDRVMPSAIVHIDSKRNSPTYAVAVILVAAILLTAVYYYTSFFTYYVFATLNLFVVFTLVSIAAIVFPYRLKGVFASSPGLVSKKIGGIPLMTILGIIGVVVNVYFGYATAQPAISPPPSGSALVQLIAYATVPLTIIAGFVIYGVAYAVRRNQGIALASVFKEIPPE
jgi:amino acid transporter